MISKLGKIFLLIPIFLNGSCGVLIGNVKPVTERSDDYIVMDLNKTKKDWSRLPPSTDETDADQGSSSDVAYQSSKTASIISLSTACRENQEYSHRELKKFRELLLLGVSDLKIESESNDPIEKKETLRSVVTGTMEGRQVKISSVVVKAIPCVYDFMYIAKPENFSLEEEVFSTFLASFRIH